MTRADAGCLGGLQTFLKYGPAEMKRRGALGGRPKKLTLAGRLSQIEIKKKEVANNPKLTIDQMRELWELELEAVSIGGMNMRNEAAT